MEVPGRYSRLPIHRRRSNDGTTVAYRARRFLPQPMSLPAKPNVTVAEYERVDLLAARHLGSPLVWWRICDANFDLSPSDLEREPGRVIRVPMNAPHLQP